MEKKRYERFKMEFVNVNQCVLMLSYNVLDDDDGESHDFGGDWIW